MKYPITVVATDQGVPPLAATCFFLVTITDVNDSPPEVKRTSFISSLICQLPGQLARYQTLAKTKRRDTTGN